jgi:hypothetical protein
MRQKYKEQRVLPYKKQRIVYEKQRGVGLTLVFEGEMNLLCEPCFLEYQNLQYGHE